MRPRFLICTTCFFLFTFCQCEAAIVVSLPNDFTNVQGFKGLSYERIGASIRFDASQDGIYRFAGNFARQNNSGGNGVDALIFLGLDLDSPIFAATTTVVGSVNAADPFANAGSLAFSFLTPMQSGESIRIAVFSDSQGQNGLFDSTAFQPNVTAVREPV